MRQVQSFAGLQNLTRFSIIINEQIDDITTSYITRHGCRTGELYLRGYFQLALG